MWSFAKKVGLCTPCAVSAVCYVGSRPGAHKGSRHGAHKVCTSHGAHKGAHKYKACAHLVAGTHSEVVRTRVRTRVGGTVRTRVGGTVRTMVCTRRSAWCAQDPWRQRNFCTLPYIYIYIGLKHLGLLLEFRLLVGIGRSGGLVAFILLQYHLSTPSWCRVMTKKPNKLTTKKATTINM